MAYTPEAEAVTCPDCGNDTKTHELYLNGLCPVVRIEWPCHRNGGMQNKEDDPRRRKALLAGMRRGCKLRDKYPPIPKGLNGERYCRGCRRQLSGRQLSWCGRDCINQAIIRCYPGAMARHVFKRDKGICARCGINLVDLDAALWWVKGHWQTLGIKAGEELKKALGFTRDHLWEADHIKPLADGGEDEPGNIRVLCVPCHKTVTAEWRRNRKAPDARISEIPAKISAIR